MDGNAIVIAVGLRKSRDLIDPASSPFWYCNSAGLNLQTSPYLVSYI